MTGVTPLFTPVDERINLIPVVGGRITVIDNNNDKTVPGGLTVIPQFILKGVERCGTKPSHPSASVSL